LTLIGNEIVRIISFIILQSPITRDAL